MGGRTHVPPGRLWNTPRAPSLCCLCVDGSPPCTPLSARTLRERPRLTPPAPTPGSIPRAQHRLWVPLGSAGPCTAGSASSSPAWPLGHRALAAFTGLAAVQAQLARFQPPQPAGLALHPLAPPPGSPPPAPREAGPPVSVTVAARPTLMTGLREGQEHCFAHVWCRLNTCRLCVDSCWVACQASLLAQGWGLLQHTGQVGPQGSRRSEGWLQTSVPETHPMKLVPWRM